jgi:hypothetical protein
MAIPRADLCDLAPNNENEANVVIEALEAGTRSPASNGFTGRRKSMGARRTSKAIATFLPRLCIARPPAK